MWRGGSSGKEERKGREAHTAKAAIATVAIVDCGCASPPFHQTPVILESSPTCAGSDFPAAIVVNDKTINKLVTASSDSAEPCRKSQEESEWPDRRAVERIALGIERTTKISRKRKDATTVGGKIETVEESVVDGIGSEASRRNSRYGGRESGKKVRREKQKTTVAAVVQKRPMLLLIFQVVVVV